MLLHRLISWCGQRNLLPWDYYGFIPTCDCSLALTTFLHDVATAKSHNQFVAAVCLDIKVAYGSVNPYILLYKLSCYGIHDKTGRWIENFIKNSWIRILWKYFTPSSAPCFQGAPQDSVLFSFFCICWMLVKSLTLAFF